MSTLRDTTYLLQATSALLAVIDVLALSDFLITSSRHLLYYSWGSLQATANFRVYVMFCIILILIISFFQRKYYVYKIVGKALVMLSTKFHTCNSALFLAFYISHSFHFIVQLCFGYQSYVSINFISSPL